MLKKILPISTWQLFRWQWQGQLPSRYGPALAKAAAANFGFLLFSLSILSMLVQLAGWPFSFSRGYFLVETILGLWLLVHYRPQADHFIAVYKRATRRLSRMTSHFNPGSRFWSSVEAKWVLTELANKVIRLEKRRERHDDHRTEVARARFRQAYSDFLELGLIRDTGYRSYYYPGKRLLGQ